MSTPEPSTWQRIIEANPGHSQFYIERFRTMAAQGHDLDGESRLVDAMVPRAARILDAGCGPGRVGGRLHQLGHRVVGVDVDPALIAAAQHDHPGPRWLTGDLAVLDLDERFDLVVCAGNVMGFLAPSTRVEVLRRFGSHLTPGGRAVIGFGAGRGYSFDEFFADAAAAGLQAQLLLESWDVRPFTPSSTFLVAIFGLRAET